MTSIPNEALRAAQEAFGGYKRAKTMHNDADAICAALTAAAPFIAAQAWDEGMRAGKSRAMRHMSDEPGLSLSIPNPYKSEH